MTVSEQLLYSTVRIETTMVDGRRKTGTGYFFQFAENGQEHVPGIVTNKHVLEDGTSIKVWLHLRDKDHNILPNSLEVNVDPIGQYCFPHPDKNIDLSVIFVMPIVSQLHLGTNSIYYAGLSSNLVPTAEESKEFVAIEDIIMIGYPNGLWDSINNMPIVRKGITATSLSINYEGRPEFLIDAACFPGSSGSPVFLFNPFQHQTKSGGTVIGQGRLKLLGTMYAGPQHYVQGEVKIVDVKQAQVPISEMLIPNNLGYVIKSNQLELFNHIFKTMKALEEVEKARQRKFDQGDS